jgi:hypothetical protein
MLLCTPFPLFRTIVNDTLDEPIFRSAPDRPLCATPASAPNGPTTSTVEEARVRRHGDSEKDLSLRGMSITKLGVENGRSQMDESDTRAATDSQS